MPPVTSPTESVPVTYAPEWAPVALTARGTAYLRLAEFRDIWSGLGPEDRAYFAEDLRDLLIDAVLPETA